jgi:hypothetical protein
VYFICILCICILWRETLLRGHRVLARVIARRLAMNPKSRVVRRGEKRWKRWSIRQKRSHTRWKKGGPGETTGGRRTGPAVSDRHPVYGVSRTWLSSHACTAERTAAQSVQGVGTQFVSWYSVVTSSWHVWSHASRRPRSKWIFRERLTL